MILSGWGRATRSECEAVGFADLSRSKNGLIAHGAGRSYGDCALNTHGGVVLTGGLDRILGWDAASGIVEVEPGVTFARLLAEFLPQNFVVPVTPGTGFATIGGAVANDVHGKNHELAGSFGQHVVSLDLVTPDGVTRSIGPDVEPELFAATVGGIGLTGVMTRIAFRMQRIAGPAMQVRSQRLPDLDSLLIAMETTSGASHSVAWIDGTATGKRLGRGILETAEPASAGDQPSRPVRRVTIPFDFPSWVLNPLSVRLFNEAYFHRVPKRGHNAVVHLARFLYPLDSLLQWNRIYGSKGFYQFQCVLPFSQAATGLRSMLELVAASRQASFLSVLKRMGAGRAGLLSFPQPGLTLALDFPAREATAALYRRLVELVIRHSGRVYLAKDALIDSDSFRAMYPEWPKFLSVLSHVDPERRMMSDMRRRLAL